MDTPQLKRIAPYARVSAAARSDETRAAHGSREFTALVSGEDAAGRRRRRRERDDEPAPEEDFAQPADLIAEAEALIAAQTAPDAENVLPEDAHGPQELRALLAVPPE